MADHSAEEFVAEVVDFIPAEFTVKDFAVELSHYNRFMSEWSQHGAEMLDSVKRAGINPAALFRIEDYKPKGTDALNPFDRTMSYSSSTCLLINSATFNETRHLIMYSILRGKGHTPNEIAKAVLSE
jgi:hypothetical protein